MWPPSTASPVGLLAPVMKLWLTPLPSRFARPIVLVAWLVQYTWAASTAIAYVPAPPVTKLWLTPLPSMFANPIVPGIAALLLQKTWADALAAPAPASATTESAQAKTTRPPNRRPRPRPTSCRAVNLIGTSLCGGDRHRDRAVRGADRNPENSTLTSAFCHSHSPFG